MGLNAIGHSVYVLQYALHTKRRSYGNCVITFIRNLPAGFLIRTTGRAFLPYFTSSTPWKTWIPATFRLSPESFRRVSASTGSLTPPPSTGKHGVPAAKILQAPFTSAFAVWPQLAQRWLVYAGEPAAGHKKLPLVIRVLFYTGKLMLPARIGWGFTCNTGKKIALNPWEVERYLWYCCLLTDKTQIGLSVAFLVIIEVLMWTHT